MNPIRRGTRQLAPAHARLLAARAEVPPEELEARFAGLAAIRDWLLAAVGGCPHTRDLLLDLVGGRLTMTEAADATGWSVSKVSRVVQASLERVRWAARLAEVAHRRFRVSTGFTLDPDTGEPVGRVPLWAVSLEQFGLRLDHPPTRDELMLFLSQRASVLRLRRGRRRYFGGWAEAPDAFWLDVTVLIANREAALAFARKNRQRVVTNLATGEEVALFRRPDERRRAA